VAEAMRIARSNQRPGQTKEQTKLIAQGIQKGIDQYKKQQKAKAREEDKRRKRSITKQAPETPVEETTQRAPIKAENPKLPWVLLTISWLGFVLFLLFSRL
jgi:hypothetical protein